MPAAERYDVVVVGGGPAGATAAYDLAKAGKRVALLDKAGRIKPCGGAVPPKLLQEFDVPAQVLVHTVTSANIISPKGRSVNMPVTGSYVGMVDRETFDPWLRKRAQAAGAVVFNAAFDRIERDATGINLQAHTSTGQPLLLKARLVIGADGALSKLAQQEIKGKHKSAVVMAYHEVVKSSASLSRHCDVIYDSQYSDDFYAWVFPHGETTSIGVGTARKNQSLREVVAKLRSAIGASANETLRCEGAPIPLKPLPRWDNGRDVVLAGDAAGAVAPASGEGIYYAMLTGRLAADAALETLRTGEAKHLANARRRFMRKHGLLFAILGFMQTYWYKTDMRRERFVSICADSDVQRLVWEGYTQKRLVFFHPVAHARIILKDMAHVLGWARP
jgi:geranylgeranyl diphosphate/geranylgeranyl-bacteriochlorophyllide a reductase